MSENLSLEAHEHREHAEHAAHEHDPFISRVSVTIAVLAVITAITGSFEVTESTGAVVAASKAVLSQDRATDSWSAYQSASIKKHMFTIAGDAATAPKSSDYGKSVTKYGFDQTRYQADAEKQEHARETAMEESELHEHRHHRLTLAATLLQIGIAICTVAIITRRRSFWLGSLGLGTTGFLVGLSTFLF